MIFLVDHDGRIAAVSVHTILTNRDIALACMIVSSSWCYSWDQAVEVSRRRRAQPGSRSQRGSSPSGGRRRS